MLPESQQLTVEEFLAFYDQRPDGEKWELIEGRAIRSPLPTQFHQLIVGNVCFLLCDHKVETDCAWTPLLGVCILVPNSRLDLPTPDFYVQEGELRDSSTTADALAVFEVLSPGNTKADRAWRKKVYSSVPNCQHYGTIATRAAEVIHHDRADGWREHRLKGLDASVELAALGVAVPLRKIYRYTPIA